jgi:hypothetical protein
MHLLCVPWATLPCTPHSFPDANSSVPCTLTVLEPHVYTMSTEYRATDPDRNKDLTDLPPNKSWENTIAMIQQGSPIKSQYNKVLKYEVCEFYCT